MVLPPQGQWRSEYTFVAPASYNEETKGQSFVLVARRTGDDITLDGESVATAWTPIKTHEWAIVPVDGGAHSMTSGAPFGAIVYGLGVFTSYTYPAGLNLERL